MERRVLPVLLLLGSLLSGCRTGPEEAPEWNAVFAPQRGFGWSGGDAAYSIALPGNRTLWLFGDSYLGGFGDSGREGLEPRFGNTVAIQQTPEPGELPVAPDNAARFDWAVPSSGGWMPLFEETVDQEKTPVSLRRAKAAGREPVAWPLHGTVVGNDLVLFNAVVTRSDCSECGPLDFEVHGVTASVVRGVDRPYDEWGFTGDGWDPAQKPEQQWVGALGGDDQLVLWGTFVHEDPSEPGTYYVYGHRQAPEERQMLVARMIALDRAVDVLDASNWQLWTDEGWGADAAPARAVADGVAVEVSVVPVPEGFDENPGVALVHSGENIFDGEVQVELAPGPEGPFERAYTLSLSDCPIAGFDPRDEVLVYAAKAHPHLSTEDAMLVSLVIAPFGERAQNLLAEPGFYTPRFIWLPWAEVIDFRRSSPDRCG